MLELFYVTCYNPQRDEEQRLLVSDRNTNGAKLQVAAWCDGTDWDVELFDFICETPNTIFKEL